LARSLGVEVIERHDREKMGKGYALNNLLDQQLRHRPFERTCSLRYRCARGTNFFEARRRYLQSGESVLQGSTVSKNPTESAMTMVGDSIQALIRLHQKGARFLDFIR